MSNATLPSQFSIEVGGMVAEHFKGSTSIHPPATDQGLQFSDDSGCDSDSGLEDLVNL